MKRKQLYISALLLTAALQWSCIEDEIDTYTNTGTSTRVNIEVTIPGNPSAPQSRALTPTTENHIQDITVLVFSPGGTFKHRADVTGIQSTAQENIKQFSVLLPGGQSDLWILANSKDMLDAYTIPANATKDMLRQNLLLKTTGTWNTASTGFTPLPMWGEKTGVNVTPGLTLTGSGNRIPLYWQ
ncbi:MAG: fimbrial protein [Tannerellaceae bacterium]|nr:fimbrial protein [Tannerellaceae bacterium]